MALTSTVYIGLYGIMYNLIQSHSQVFAIMIERLVSDSPSIKLKPGEINGLPRSKTDKLTIGIT